jgi:hypothetical protein
MASLVKNQARFVEPFNLLFDKGKPVEKQGRKAMDLQSRKHVTTTARPPKTR